MKNIKYLIITLYLVFTGCEDVLDKQPLDLIPDAVVWTDESLVEAYLNDLYYRTDFVNLTGQSGYNQGLIAGMGAESRAFGGWQEPSKYAILVLDETGAPGSLDYWKYSNIRDANYFMEKLTESDFPQEYIDLKIAEARFLRAYMYFEMVKRYGGVPIITVVQNIDTPEEELFVSRNTEKEVYDFIASETDAIALVLPESYGAEGKGRPTKWAALALKSRAMLYAASIAKYGSVQMNGLLGFPASDEQSYAQKSYDASLAIINSGYFSLYNEHADPMHNFGQIFIDESDANKEVIFSERFDFSQQLGHSLGNLAMPDGFAVGWGSNFNFFYDHVELFEFADGSPGTSVSRTDLTSQEWTMDSLFNNRDPRFKATVFYPEAPWGGDQVLFHSSTLEGGVEKTSGFIGPDLWPAKAPRRNILRTGFHLRKRIDENSIGLRGGEDNTDYLVFRLGEIYLNQAEAAFYLGNTGEALTLINDLRARAGMPPKGAITEDVIRNERAVELTFEDHRYYDLRRWRIAEQVLNGLRTQGLKYVYNYDTKKYQISLKNAEGVERTFQERHYYYPLGINRLADNTNLVDNPGY